MPMVTLPQPRHKIVVSKVFYGGGTAMWKQAPGKECIAIFSGAGTGRFDVHVSPLHYPSDVREVSELSH